MRKRKVIVGDKIKILGFASDKDGTIPKSEQNLIGKTGKVTFIGGLGELHGTWGGLSILPEDDIEILE